VTGGTKPLASNIYWKVAAAVTAGVNSELKGNIIAAAAVTFGAGAKLNGRISSAATVTLDCLDASKIAICADHATRRGG